MYMKEPAGEFQVSLTPMTLFVVIIGLIGTIQLGIFPDTIISLTIH
jgi:NADH-quinone oxidoreductase subunit N